MNGLATEQQHSQSLLQDSHTDVAAPARPNGAGSTTNSNDALSSPHDSPASTDPNPAPHSATDVSPDSLSSSTQAASNSSGTAEAATVQKAEVIGGSSDKGEGSGSANALSETANVKEEGELLLDSVNGRIELLEHEQEVAVGSDEGGLLGSDDGPTWIPEPENELKRVKVYELIGSRWIDQGTAFCFGQFSEESNEALLIARSERNYNDIILSTTIRSNDVYQRQQDTLIVWTEPDGVDYALSFQDPEGCAEVWNFILEVQRHMNASGMSADDPNISSPLLGETSVTTASIIRSGHLPTPQMGIISEIERAIKSLARTQQVKERICEYIQHEEYIKSLIEVMHTAEDLESLENLHALCSLMQTILMLNDHSMYEHILEDEYIFGVVGMLEYDPDFPGHKANYREFLHNTAQFHQPIPVRDMAVQRKIHHTYRLQFLKDVVLARALDDSTFNVLNSSIIFNQIDIINHIQQDQSFLREVVRLFVDEEMLTGGARRGQQLQQLQQSQSQQQNQPPHMIISLNGNGDNVSKPDSAAPMEVDQKPATSSPKPVNGTVALVNGRGAKSQGTYAFAPPDNLTENEIALRREVILLLQHLCTMGKNVQMPARMTLFRSLVDRGILFAVQWGLSLPEKVDANRPVISAAGEVLSSMLDHDLNGVRGHVLKQVVAIEKEREAGKKGADKAETILEMACRIMATSKDLGFQSQIGDALKVWMDVPAADRTQQLVIPRDDPGTERYMDYFYKDCVSILLKPLADLSEWKNFPQPILPLTRDETNRFVYLCDLLYSFILQHHFRSHFYLMSSDLLPRVATLFKAKDKHLRHAAFRIFRLLLKQNNPNSHVQILKHDIMKPILDLTIQESTRDNLLSCSCQEYFEHMRKENMKDLIRFCMSKHEPEIHRLAKSPLGGQRFELFIRRYEMNIAPPPEESTPDRSTADRAWSGPGRALDLEEEDYFNADDDDSEVIPSISQQLWNRSAGTTSPLPANNTGMKRKRRTAVGAASKAYRPPLKTPQLSALVDYGEDDDETLATGQAISPLGQPPSPGSLIGDSSSSPKLSGRSPSPSPATSPVLQSTPPPIGLPPKRVPKEDDDDNVIASLVRTRTRSQASAAPSPMRASEKRRRTEDDDDELLDRLKSSKKPDFGNQKESTPSIGGRLKNGDDPPAKKIKVKFGPFGLAVASSPNSTSTPPATTTTTSTSEPGKKDGDTG
ncbi:hypothetical protein NLJ89_g9480 [Agrocybe chaxingu]|uniref:Serine/threonine-protein phosphatase 4 regulatory subunit 3-like central domain-containing protein n=1 Tax=Agrocybe chaxingu TaxID=84603 RepID=A0A9W8JSZ2_9AGAR|nr:hypothetical protein NLJ89_g9480 [Agrocybe chaxingu]